MSAGEPNTQQLLAAYLLARKFELFVFLAWCCCLPKGVAIPSQVGQQGYSECSMKNENPPFKIHLLFRDFCHMIFKSCPIIVEISLNCLKIMTAVTSHLLLPGLISEMPPGSAKDIVMQLYGQHDWSSLCLYILHFSFYFKCWARVMGSVACKKVLWNTTVIFSGRTELPHLWEARSGFKSLTFISASALH